MKTLTNLYESFNGKYKILDNEMMADKPSDIYYYIINDKGEIYHHDGTFKKKIVMGGDSYKTFKFKKESEAENKLKDLNKA